MYGISVFFKDLASELGISRAVTSVAAGVGRLEGGITSPLVGWLSDRYGPKWLIFTGSLIAGCGMILMYFIHSVWSYIVTWGVLIGVGLNIGLTVSVDKSINDWFIRKLGLAMGTKFALIGVVGMLLLPTSAWLVSVHGWRITCLIMGIVMLILSPLTLIFVRQRRPEYYGLLPDGKTEIHSNSPGTYGMNEKKAYPPPFMVNEFSLKQALKTRSYWIICFVYAAQTIVIGAISVHLIPFLTDMGIDRTLAGGMMGMMVFFTIPSRFFSGILADRMKKEHLKFLLAGVFFLLATGVLMFTVFRSMLLMYLMFAIYGLSSGAPTPLLIILTSRYYGRKAFGSINGSSLIIRAPLALLAPVFAGWVYDKTGNYMIVFYLFVVLLIFGIAFICLADPPNPEKQPFDYPHFEKPQK
ncbi:MAG: MFS transporter [Deltaproteobacteria bacterium]|nr:MFS transporter [Deltaproteobacteria bacterium]